MARSAFNLLFVCFGLLSVCRCFSNSIFFNSSRLFCFSLINFSFSNSSAVLSDSGCFSFVNYLYQFFHFRRVASLTVNWLSFFSASSSFILSRASILFSNSINSWNSTWGLEFRVVSGLAFARLNLITGFVVSETVLFLCSHPGIFFCKKILLNRL